MKTIIETSNETLQMGTDGNLVSTSFKQWADFAGRVGGGEFEYSSDLELLGKDGWHYLYEGPDGVQVVRVNRPVAP